MRGIVVAMSVKVLFYEKINFFRLRSLVKNVKVNKTTILEGCF